MHSENGLSLDLQELHDAIAKSDVLVLGFLHLTPRVLFDTRPGPDGPLFRLVKPVRTPDERFAQLRRLRPAVREPERFVFIQWPLGLDSLVSLDAWSTIVAHAEQAAGARGAEDCAGIFKRLQRLDRQETHAAIAGDSYKTLWPAREGR